MNTNSASVRDIAKSLQEQTGIGEVATVTVAKLKHDKP